MSALEQLVRGIVRDEIRKHAKRNARKLRTGRIRVTSQTDGTSLIDDSPVTVGGITGFLDFRSTDPDGARNGDLDLGDIPVVNSESNPSRPNRPHTPLTLDGELDLDGSVTSTLQRVEYLLANIASRLCGYAVIPATYGDAARHDDSPSVGADRESASPIVGDVSGPVPPSAGPETPSEGSEPTA